MSLFPFDPIGNLTSNRIQNEPHTLTEVNGADHAYFVPRNAPFYNDSLHIVEASSGQTLTLGQDYFFAYPFAEASQKTGMAVSGAVGFYDVNRMGTYYLSYQTLGGEYVDEETQAITDGLAALDALLYPDWTDVVNVPATFPPTPHQLRLDHVAGIAGVIAELERIAAAVRAPERRIFMEDIVDLDNTYITPLMDNLWGISEAIHSLETSRNYYTAEVTTGNMDVVIESVQPNTWTPIGLEYAVDVNGTYLLTCDGNPQCVDVDGNVIRGSNPPSVEVRFVINNVPISQSMLRSTLIGLQLGQTLGMQIRVVNATLPQTVKTAGPHISCGMALLKVSN